MSIYHHPHIQLKVAKIYSQCWQWEFFCNSLSSWLPHCPSSSTLAVTNKTSFIDPTLQGFSFGVSSWHSWENTVYQPGKATCLSETTFWLLACIYKQIGKQLGSWSAGISEASWSRSTMFLKQDISRFGQSELPRPILPKFCGIRSWIDVHWGSTLIMRVITCSWHYIPCRWHHRNHVNTITCVTV